MPALTQHGGADALGQALHDFSTNSNACGPCPGALNAVQSADSRHYPDPAYTALRETLARFHNVAAWRIAIAGSASEFIHRLTQWAQGQGIQQVQLPPHSYGDYAQAALARGLPIERRTADTTATEPIQNHAMLQWACEPSSPCGWQDPALALWQARSDALALWRIADCAYAPLRLDMAKNETWLDHSVRLQAHCWQLFSPNKALGMTGIRAAYALAPLPAGSSEALIARAVEQLQALAPSWPLGSHGVAMLHAWAESNTQQWLAQSRVQLREWKARQIKLCDQLGWQVLPRSLANYFVVRPGIAALPEVLQSLRQNGIKLRDCHSFGLPGHLRLGVLAPASQDALQSAWASVLAAQ